MKQSGKERITTMAANGGPPQAAACLYLGEVMHQRMRPLAHRFSYRVFSLLIDLDRLGEAGIGRLFAVDRAGIVAFHQSDHALCEGEPLRAMADRLFRQAGIAARPARILLLCYPRMFGYVFNPLSVFFAYGADDRPLGVIYAVRNTFGERHLYVAALADGEIGPQGIRQERAKRFHVSPFIGMDARYRFRILPPGRIVRVRIHATEEDAALMAATFIGRFVPLKARSLLATLCAMPFMTWKVIAGIHWEASKLWLKGARFRTSPAPGETVTFEDGPRPLPPGK